jgi:hypothetical protein
VCYVRAQERAETVRNRAIGSANWRPAGEAPTESPPGQRFFLIFFLIFSLTAGNARIYSLRLEKCDEQEMRDFHVCCSWRLAV